MRKLFYLFSLLCFVSFIFESCKERNSTALTTVLIETGDVREPYILFKVTRIVKNGDTVYKVRVDSRDTTNGQASTQWVTLDNESIINDFNRVKQNPKVEENAEN